MGLSEITETWGYSSAGRAAVSKTVGPEFDPLCPRRKPEICRFHLQISGFCRFKFKAQNPANLKTASGPTVSLNCEVQNMRMKTVYDNRTLRDAASEFLSLKKAQKVRKRTLDDYQKYINKFIDQSSNSLDVDILKSELLEYFSEIPQTSPARFNHPYQYLHALFSWCAKQDYLPYNPFDKLQLKKIRDDGNVQPAEIASIQTFLKSLDKHNYTELRDYNIVLLILDTGIRTSELMALRDDDFDPNTQSIFIRPEVAKTSRSRTLYLSPMTNSSLKKFLKVKPAEWEHWIFPTRDGMQLKANVLGRNFRKYCKRSGVKFTPYQIRHSFATFYLENGGDLFTLQRQMGHTDLQMTKRYTEISDKLLVECHKNYSPIGLLQSSTRKVKT